MADAELERRETLKFLLERARPFDLFRSGLGLALSPIGGIGGGMGGTLHSVLPCDVFASKLMKQHARGRIINAQETSGKQDSDGC